MVQIPDFYNNIQSDNHDHTRHYRIDRFIFYKFSCKQIRRYHGGNQKSFVNEKQTTP